MVISYLVMWGLRLIQGKVVKNWPWPLPPTGIRSILGVAGYYWRFLYGLASVTSP